MKTLKDITETEWDIEVTPEEYFALIKNLKQEAIKWVKYLQSVEQELSKDIKLADNNTYRAQVKWIKHFFNITDEELK